MSIIVSIINSHINQFQYLPTRVYSEKLNTDIIIHSDPQIEINGNVVKTNFDFLLTDNFNEAINKSLNWEDLLSPNQLYISKRLPKHLINFNLNKISQKYPNSNFRPIHVWFNNNLYPNFLREFLTDLPNRFIIKPNYGANGDELIFVDSTGISLDALFANLPEFSNYPKEICEAFKPYISHTNSTLTEIKSNLLGFGYSIFEYIENVQNEYRLITNAYNQPQYIIKRTRNKIDPDSEFKIASGKSYKDYKENILSYENFLEEVNIKSDTDDMELLNKMLTYIGPLNSIDFFTTTDNKWGIFEFCNQFGVSSIPPEMLKNLLIGFIEFLLENYLNKID